MTRKALKIAAVVLILLGLVVATSNFVDTELHSDGPFVKRNYIQSPPDCTGSGDTCYDFTDPNPK